MLDEVISVRHPLPLVDKNEFLLDQRHQRIDRDQVQMLHQRLVILWILVFVLRGEALRYALHFACEFAQLLYVKDMGLLELVLVILEGHPHRLVDHAREVLGVQMALLHWRIVFNLDLLHLLVLLVDLALAHVDDSLQFLRDLQLGHLLEVAHVLDLVCQQPRFDVLVLDQVFKEKVLEELKLQVHFHFDPLLSQSAQVCFDNVLAQIDEFLQTG